MIELNSVSVILALEVLVVLLVAVIWLLIASRKNKTQTFDIAEKLVDALDDTEAERTQKLSNLITSNCQIDAKNLQALLQDIALHEKALYRLIVQIILHGDSESLKELQDYIYGLAKPYCRLLQFGPMPYHEPVVQEMPVANADDLNFANKEIVRLADENTALVGQLQQALKTADSITEEYARVFSGKQEEAELRASAKRMLSIFEEALDKAKAQAAISLLDEPNL